MTSKKKDTLVEEPKCHIGGKVKVYNLNHEQLVLYLQMSPDKKTEFLSQIKSKK